MRIGMLSALLLGCGRVGFDPGGGAPDGPGSLDAVDSAAPDPCATTTDPETVALYTFEAGLGQDSTGAHHATVRGGVVASAGSCGTTAAQFTTGAYLLVADSPAFDLATVSVELHVRVPTLAAIDNQTVLARDANGTNFDGHFTVFFNLTGVLVVRLQRGGASYYRCAPPITLATWAHVGISVGEGGGQGLRMWVDHVEASLPTAIVSAGSVDCTAAVPTGGLAGNDNTWTIGGSNAIGLDGDTDPLTDQFVIGGSVDQVRIRSVTRDFSTP